MLVRGAARTLGTVHQALPWVFSKAAGTASAATRTVTASNRFILASPAPAVKSVPVQALFSTAATAAPTGAPASTAAAAAAAAVPVGAQTTVDAEEVAKFGAMAATWWDPLGPFRPLHNMNPCRMGFVASVARDHFGTPAAAPLQGLSVLDVGSGGGLLCESLARLGPSSVLGVDASPDNVRMARAHAGGDPTLRALQYRHCTAEALVAAGRQFDLVCSVEVIEHVHDAQFFAAVCLQLVRPGGLLVLSTLSRTAKSYLSAIIGAEYVLRWVPPGTHDWHKFLSPYEMQELLRSAHETPLTGLYPRLIADSVAADSAGVKPARRSVVDIGSMTTSGMLYRPPPRDTWELDGEDFESNYIAAFKVQ